MYRSKFCVLIILIFCAGCSTSPSIQPTINSLVSAGQYDYAAYMLTEHKQAYGSQNELLYWLDAGMVYHLSGQIDQSIYAFKRAKTIYENALPRSISDEVEAIIWNDNRRQYRAEVYERILINIFQALNFAMLDDFESARIEIRDADFQLRRFETYGDNDNEVYFYTEAFIRFFSGLIFESDPTRTNLEHALIDYQKALELYTKPFKKFEIESPAILLNRIKEVQALLNGQLPLKDYQQGHLVVVAYDGVVPIKYERMIVVPVDDIVTKIAVPFMDRRGLETSAPIIEIKEQNENRYLDQNEDLVLNIEDVAMQRHKDKMKVIVPKTVVRAGAKIMAERALRQKIEDDYGKNKAKWFSYASGLYNFATENADLRSWQSLPGAIYIGWYDLKPGAYSVFLDDRLIADDVGVKADQVRFVSGRKPF